MRGARPGRVIVVGAGPTGLALAAELALAGVPCLVLERRGGLREDSRAICLHARTMEVLDLRGQAGRFAEAGLAVLLSHSGRGALDEVRNSLVRVTGQDFGPRDMAWSGWYRSESRQSPGYRNGRIFLAGDAAHTHSPAGAQGMNTGLQDAVNLGWKLAAAAGGWAPDWLLDTYHAERHPVGAAVLPHRFGQAGRLRGLGLRRPGSAGPGPGRPGRRPLVVRLTVPVTAPDWPP